MAEVTLRAVESRAQNDQAVQAQLALSALQQEIQAHREADKNRSYLDKAFDFVWRSDEKSLKKLENLEYDMKRDLSVGNVEAASRMRDEVFAAIQKDQRLLLSATAWIVLLAVRSEPVRSIHVLPPAA